ncbi:hypothetical protein EPN95_03690 [Patescibacteria group bacterium]|nr:MAG: hypothetical protein EPN95_03690 [Patescibacteria group bacterium]
MRALEATPENFRSSLVSLAEVGSTDPNQLWTTLQTLQLKRTLRRGYYTLRADSLLAVQKYDLGNNAPSVARLDLIEPRRLGRDRAGAYFFDTEQDETAEDIAVKGGLQVLEGSLNTGRSKDLRELIKDAQLQARSKSDEFFM